MGKTTRVEAAWVSGHRFVTATGSGHTAVVDNPTHPDGKAASPMEMVLVAVAGCAGIDVVSILEKMRQTPDRVEVSTSGARRETHPKVFERIELVFRLWGRDLDPEKVVRATALSEETYCSALAMVKSTAKVSRRVEVNGALVFGNPD